MYDVGHICVILGYTGEITSYIDTTINSVHKIFILCMYYLHKLSKKINIIESWNSKLTKSTKLIKLK